MKCDGPPGPSGSDEEIIVFRNLINMWESAPVCGAHLGQGRLREASG